MLDTDVNSLWNDTGVNTLVNDDTDGACRNIENSSGLSVVELVWHASLDGAISNYIDVISFLVVDEVFAEVEF